MEITKLFSRKRINQFRKRYTIDLRHDRGLSEGKLYTVKVVNKSPSNVIGKGLINIQSW